eukprot:scaffold189537_cov43-Prasinocladus_malaysianus.AAC.1
MLIPTPSLLRFCGQNRNQGQMLVARIVISGNRSLARIALIMNHDPTAAVLKKRISQRRSHLALGVVDKQDPAIG